MSVFNENGQLVYSGSYNSSMSLESVMSAIDRSKEIDSLLESINYEISVQYDAINIVLETVGLNEGVILNGLSKFFELIKKGIDALSEVLSSLAPSKKRILINKKKIEDNFKNINYNDRVKNAIKNYKSVAKINPSDMLENIKSAIKENNDSIGKVLTMHRNNVAKALIGKGVSSEYQKEILSVIGPDENADYNPNGINISDVISCATSIDKIVPKIKEIKRSIEKENKELESIINSTTEDLKAYQECLKMISFYSTEAIKSIKLLTTSSVELCLAVLKNKEVKDE